MENDLEFGIWGIKMSKGVNKQNKAGMHLTRHKGE
jgi:hypothetical protein